MKLDLLLQREDFSEIFHQTMKEYLENHCSWSGTIKWSKSTIFASAKNRFLINDKLNVIYNNHLERDKLYDLTAEFAYHPNLIRRILQKIYVKLATTNMFENHMSSNTLIITPVLSEMENWCIIPGNHSIRIIDLEKNICIVILKKGFNKSFILNEIKTRKKYRFLPIPNILQVDEKACYYTEERIIALPWNRVSNQEIKKNVLHQVQNEMLKLYKETYSQRVLSEYLNNLTNKINTALEKLPSIYISNDKKEIISFYKLLLSMVQKNNKNTVGTVYSHGDFQPANILIDIKSGSNNVSIIDWEYSGEKFYLYDALLFASECRMTVGLAERVEKIRIGQVDTFAKLDWIQKEYGDENIVLMDWSIALFLIEDLLVRLEELQIPTLKSKSKSLIQFIIEVNKIQWLDNE